MKPILSSALLVCIAGCASNRPTCVTHGPPQPPSHTCDAQRVTFSDGKRLPEITVRPPLGVCTKGVVIVVPGLDGTLGDYRSLTRSLAQHGYVVRGYEQRTMKYDPDERKRGTANDWHPWVRDLKEFAVRVRKENPGVPLCIHGHSFGAVVAMEAIAEGLHGSAKDAWVPESLILQSPAYALLPKANPLPVSALLLPFGGVRVKLISLMQSLRLKYTRNPDFNCAWMRSKSRLEQGYTLGWFGQATAMGHQARIFSESGNLPPTLVLRGEKDFVSLMGTPDQVFALRPEKFAAYVGVIGKAPNALKSYPEGCHLLTEGEGKGEVIHDILAWLDSRK